MARPVDAEALEKKISEWLGQPGNGDYYSGYDAALCAVQDLIADTPTLAPPNEALTMEQLRESPHGKIKDSTLQSICNGANEIASRPPEQDVRNLEAKVEYRKAVLEILTNELD